MSDYPTLLGWAEGLLQDQNDSLSTAEKQQSFREALAKYSRDVPREVYEDFTGDGSLYQFTFTGPFSVGFSQVKRVELPVGQRPARFLPLDEYGLYQSDETTVKLDLPYETPASGDTVRVIFTALHTIDDLDAATATTVATWHEEAFVMLAASRMLARLAARFIHEQDSTIDSDAIGRGTKDESAAKRSRALLQDYENLLGIKRGVTPGVVVIDLDTSLSGSGMDYLTHPRRWR